MRQGSGGDGGWKALLYMGWARDPDSEPIQEAVLTEIAKAALGVELVYQFAREACVERGTIRNGTRAILATSPPITITDPHHLTRFLDWAHATSPSRNTALFVKDHGQGPTNVFRKPMTYATGILRDGNRYMQLPAFADEIARSRAGRVDFLGLDACKLGSIEAAYELRHVATVLVASDMSVKTTGWAYPDILAGLGARDRVAPRELAAEVITSTPKFGLVSLELTWMERVKAAFDVLGQRLGTNMEALATWASSSAVPKGGDGLTIDQLLEKLRSREDLCDPKLLDAIASAVASARVLPDPPPASSPGIGIYFPTTTGSRSISNYGTLAFAIDTCWAELVGQLNYFLINESAQ